jgi:hypothetical protein
MAHLVAAVQEHRKPGVDGPWDPIEPAAFLARLGRRLLGADGAADLVAWVRPYAWEYADVASEVADRLGLPDAVALTDDLGDLVIHGRDDDGFASARVWVSDFDDEVLVDAASAWYVPTLGVTSPMGHGLLAFSDRARAEAFATAIEGEAIDWDTVVGLPVIGGRVGHHHEGSTTQGGHGHGR